jgi:hypothetical protein
MENNCSLQYSLLKRTRKQRTIPTCSEMSQRESTTPRKQRRVSVRWERVQVPLVLLLSFLISAGAFLGRHKKCYNKHTTSRTSASRVLQISGRGSTRPAVPLYSLFGGESAPSEPGKSRVNGVSSQTQKNNSSPTKFEWEVLVDQSKSSLDKGGSATLDAFVGLAPPGTVKVQPVILSKIKSKGPLVRCISAQSSNKDSFDVSNVDSVDKVYRILTRHMKVEVREECMSRIHLDVGIHICCTGMYSSLHFLKPFSSFLLV